MSTTDAGPHWTPAQQSRLAELIAAGTWIGYSCSDAHGYPANGGGRDVRCYPGAVHEAPGPLRGSCGEGQLHATRDPLAWRGARVWIVALHGDVRSDANKAWSLRREIIGEVLPGEALCERLGARLGRRDLRRADLIGANLSAADLIDADLWRAGLWRADLRRANLIGADLRRADLSGADLRRADLSGANLHDADLSGADLRRADLSDANLRRANLSGANLRRARRNSGDPPIDGWQVVNGRLSVPDLA